MIRQQAHMQPPWTSCQTAVAMCWPDGRPCHEVEMYLLEACYHYSVRSLDGGSLRVIASQLSPLIRYCWTRRIQFRDLEDGHFAEAIGELGRGSPVDRGNGAEITIRQTG